MSAPFTLVPAIDLRGGRCVRLRQGEAGSETVYGEDPAAVAASFAEAGARWLHVVDLDGAFSGAPVNTEAITRIVAAARGRGMDVEVGGGLRELKHVEAVLATGAKWAMMGTVALRDEALLAACIHSFPGQIAVGIDARAGLVTVAGWTEGSGVRATELARRVADAGVSHIVYTDVARDGMLTGPNLDETRAVALAAGVPVIASGGVSNLDDVLRCARLRGDGVRGVIAGRALYEGRLDVRSALDALAQEAS